MTSPMDTRIDNGKAFAIPELWAASTLANFDRPPTKDPIISNLDTSYLGEDYDAPCAFPRAKDLHLPELSDLQYGPIGDLPTLDTSSISSPTESLDVAGRIKEDIWRFPKPTIDERNRLKTWETFCDRSFQEPRTVYISEGGPLVFDAALLAADGTEDSVAGSAGVVIQSNLLLKSLLQLGLGRESVLYQYSEEKLSFYPLIEDGRMSGYSLDAFLTLSSSLIDVGNKFRDLRRFVEDTHSTESSRSQVALAVSFSNILNTLQLQLGDPLTPKRSLSQLQLLFERPRLILSCLSNIVENIQDTTNDEELLSQLYEIADGSEFTALWLRPMTLRILASVSRPWLECVSSWLGLHVVRSSGSQQQHLPSFVRRDEMTRKIDGGRESTTIDYDFEPHRMPSFIRKEDAQMMFDTGRSLQLLRTHRPEHPLFGLPAFNEFNPADLEWHFSWKDVGRIQAQAKAYETELRKAIKDFDSQGGNPVLSTSSNNVAKQEYTLELVGISEDEAKAYISASISVIETPLPQWNSNHGELMSSDRNLFEGYDVPDDEIFAPPTSLLPILSFSPLVLAQTHLVNHACLRLLFKEHGIRSHLSLLYRYCFFGDGVFASRLSHALFDPDYQTAERRKGRSRIGIPGLKLGSRETWPPASSELRLALTGILAESYYETKPTRDISSMFRNELPGGLSFSIREMTEDKLQGCMNPDSIEALDFLRLNYRPQSPIDAVITPSALLKYDAIFKLLLRAARMLFVINQLFRDTKSRARNRERLDPLTQSFGIESHHFVSATCNYFFEGVRANWNKLEDRMKCVERELDRGGSDNLPDLRDFHERILDGLMFALMLRKRQEQVMKLLEDIYSLVLQFAKHIRLQNAAINGVESAPSEGDLKDIYRRFQKKVRVFVSVCRGLSERRGPGGTSSALSRDETTREDAGNTISHLLLKLEVSGFYAKH